MIMIFWCGVFESIAEDCGFKNKVLDLTTTLRPVDPTIKTPDVLEDELKNQDTLIEQLNERLVKIKKETEEAKNNKVILTNRLNSEKYKDIESRINEYNLLVKSKNNAKAEVDALKIEVKNKLDKIKKLGDLTYDDDCEYCMNNIFVKDL